MTLDVPGSCRSALQFGEDGVRRWVEPTPTQGQRPAVWTVQKMEGGGTEGVEPTLSLRDGVGQKMTPP